MQIDASTAWYGQYRRLASTHLRKVFETLQGPVYDLCAYHLGWTDEFGRPQDGQAGKMLRPVLALAACCGYADPARATEAAAAIELLHAFSLVHDDIEDSDRERRHRPTLWALHGIPLALNAGDALYALATRVLYGATAALPGDRVPQALDLFSSTCLRLVEGQHADLEFEQAPVVGLEAYEEMVRGKTGAVLGLSLALGALFGGAEPGDVENLHQAGIELGLAFQARDDALALWGDPALLGKATGNDLVRKKKSLPVVLAPMHGIDPAALSGCSVQAARASLEHAGVGHAIEQFAADHAGASRRLIGATRMSGSGRAQVLALVDRAVTRES